MTDHEVRALVAERARLHEQYEAEKARCKASEPHGYAVCQMRYGKIEGAIDHIDRELRARGILPVPVGG